MIPEFKRREVAVAIPEEIHGLGNGKDVIGTILYLGAQCDLGYQIGDKILFPEATRKELKQFTPPIWRIENEGYIICKVIDE